MRLSQVARKLGVTPTTVQELLVEKGYESPKNGNVKLNEEQIAELYKHFDITVFTEPEVIKEMEEEQVTEEAVTSEERANEEITNETLKEELVSEETSEEVKEAENR